MSAPKNDTAGSPYQVPPEPNRWPSIGLAVGVHALLLAFLWIGVSWQNNTPVTLEAEVWDVQTQTAAPPPPPPTPAPEPEPEPETPPPPVPRAVEPPPPPVVKPAPPKTPDIALEREKKRKEELQRKQEQQEEERLERQRELAEQKRADEKKAKALADKRERELAEKKERELAEKKEADKKAEQLAKLEQAKKEEADKKKKADKEKADKLAKEKAKEKTEAEQLAKLAKMTRDSETKRLTGSGNPGSTGSAEKSTAPRLDAGYLGAIAAKIKSNANYAGDTDVPGNPTVSFIVQQLPTGEIVSVKKVKSSGIPEFDEAVERSINKSSPLPKKKDGTVEKTLPVNFHMKDLN